MKEYESNKPFLAFGEHPQVSDVDTAKTKIKKSLLWIRCEHGSLSVFSPNAAKLFHCGSSIFLLASQSSKYIKKGSQSLRNYHTP